MIVLHWAYCLSNNCKWYSIVYKWILMNNHELKKGSLHAARVSAKLICYCISIFVALILLACIFNSKLQPQYRGSMLVTCHRPIARRSLKCNFMLLFLLVWRQLVLSQEKLQLFYSTVFIIPGHSSNVINLYQ